MTPEEKAREKLDAILSASGWVVQTRDEIDLSAAPGVAICELAFATGEPVGVTLTSIEEPSAKYVAGLPSGLSAWHKPMRFCYESTGTETFSTNLLDPQPRSRRLFSFHRPETLFTGFNRKSYWPGALSMLCQT